MQPNYIVFGIMGLLMVGGLSLAIYFLLREERQKSIRQKWYIPCENGNQVLHCVGQHGERVIFHIDKMKFVFYCQPQRWTEYGSTPARYYQNSEGKLFCIEEDYDNKLKVKETSYSGLVSHMEEACYSVDEIERIVPRKRIIT